MPKMLHLSPKPTTQFLVRWTTYEKSYFDHDRIVLTTDLDWFASQTSEGNRQLILSKNLGGLQSDLAPGQETIWLKPREGGLSKGLVLHELMHISHSGLNGIRQPHAPEFNYLTGR